MLHPDNRCLLVTSKTAVCRWVTSFNDQCSICLNVLNGRLNSQLPISHGYWVNLYIMFHSNANILKVVYHTVLKFSLKM